MSARAMKRGTVHFYYRTRTGGKVPLGTNLAAARLKWAQLEAAGAVQPSSGLRSVAGRFEREALVELAPKTRREYSAALRRLVSAFGHGTMEQIKPVHIAQYLDRRTAKVAGNREIAVLSSLWTWARKLGITEAPNPCVKIRNRERPREVYVTDEQFRAVYDQGDDVLRDALDLARLTGQREADILRMRRDDIRDGHLWVRQRKTGARVGIAVVGDLETVIERMRKRERTATGPHLVQTDSGQHCTYTMLRRRFDRARLAAGTVWQFRDLRAKAATDASTLRHAQELLGHRSETTTAGIYRRTRGTTVEPVR